MATTPQQLEIYRELIDQVGSGASAGGTVAQTAFTQFFCEFLTEKAHYISDLTPAYFFKKWKTANVRVDAYYLDEQTHDLTLVVSDFSDAEEPEQIGLPDARKAFEQVRRFYRASMVKEFRQGLEETDEVRPLAQLIYDNQKLITRVRYVLVTNKSLGSRVKDDAFDELKSTSDNSQVQSEFTVWDFFRYAETVSSANPPAEIEVDCTKHSPEGKGLPFLTSPDAGLLPGQNGQREYSAYLLMVPGKCVYDWYAQYADRLLEQNVRTFLQFKGKVNKGIRDTVKFYPGRFLAYNNGLTATASEVEIDKKSGRITKIINLQIVNGGQTTASIYTAGNVYPESLSSISVQMKLIVLHPDESFERLVSKISLYANSQNKIRATDFASNHGYLVKLEHYSQHITANPGGTIRGTRWFFERTRGQYLNRINTLKTDAEKRRFQTMYPKGQVIAKSDLSKYLLSWDWRPWIAAKSGEAGFIELSKMRYGTPDNTPGNESVAPWVDNDSHGNAQFNDYYYRQLVAKAILYKALDKAVLRQEWYKGYKTQVVSYTISLFHRLVYRRGSIFDLVKIWNLQAVPVDVFDYLIVLASRISEYIWTKGEGHNLFNLCNKESFWRDVTVDFGNEVVPEFIIKGWTLSLPEYRAAVDDSTKVAERESAQSILTQIFSAEDEMWLQMRQMITTHSIDVKPSWLAALSRRINSKNSVDVNAAKALLRLWDLMFREYNFPDPPPSETESVA